MHAEIKDGFVRLAKERETLIKVLNDQEDIGTKRLEFWPLFNTACVIAENYHSDVRKKLKLEMALGYLENAKTEMEKYGVFQEDFLKVENALRVIINTIGKVVMSKYKARVSEVRDSAAELGVSFSPSPD